MEVFSIIVSIIIIVFGILQVILFFKTWVMTNDVSQIKSKLLEPKEEDDSQEYELLVICGKYDIAFDMLSMKMSADIRNAYYSFNEFLFQKEFERIVDSYQQKFRRINREIPEHILKCTDVNHLKNALGK